MKKRTLAIMCLALSGMMLFAGCQKKEEAKPADTATTQTQEAKIDADQTINIIGSNFSSLDPSVVSDSDSFTALINTMEGLFREFTTPDGKVTSELAGAEKMEKNADATVYTFKIRDHKWSDGKPVTAQQYEYSWKRLSDSRVSQDYLGFLEEIGVKGAAECVKADPKDNAAVEKALAGLGVKAIDDKTFQVTLAQPTPAFEGALTFKGLVPQREDKVKELGKEYGTDYKKMVYNGPFIISEYAKDSKLVYKKNESYWDAKNVKLQTANCFIITEPTTMVKMFENKEVDITGATGDDLAKLQARAKNGEIDYVTGTKPSIYYYVFNTQNKVLANAKVRLALSLAFDRQQQINVVWKRYFPTTALIPGGVTLGKDEYRKVVPEPLKSVKDDPKALMEAGLKELGLTADKVELKLLLSKASSTTTAQAQFIQKQWQDKLGIKINIQHAVDSTAYFAQRSKGDFDICSGGWGADYNDVASFFPLFTTGNGNNNGKYSNPTYDKLVTEAGKTMDSAKRLEMYKQAEEILVAKDAAIAPYFYQDIHSFRHKYLKGYQLSTFTGNFDLKWTYVQGKSK